jgi:hypothetical protein
MQVRGVESYSFLRLLLVLLSRPIKEAAREKRKEGKKVEGEASASREINGTMRTKLNEP